MYTEAPFFVCSFAETRRDAKKQVLPPPVVGPSAGLGIGVNLQSVDAEGLPDLVRIIIPLAALAQPAQAGIRGVGWPDGVRGTDGGCRGYRSIYLVEAL